MRTLQSISDPSMLICAGASAVPCSVPIAKGFRLGTSRLVMLAAVSGPSKKARFSATTCRSSMPQVRPSTMFAAICEGSSQAAPAPNFTRADSPGFSSVISRCTTEGLIFRTGRVAALFALLAMFVSLL